MTLPISPNGPIKSSSNTSLPESSGKLQHRRCVCLRRCMNYLCSLAGYYYQDQDSKPMKDPQKINEKKDKDEDDYNVAQIAQAFEGAINPQVERLIDQGTEALGTYLKGQSAAHIPIVGPSLAPSVDGSMAVANTLIKRGVKASTTKSTTAAAGASVEGVKAVGRSAEGSAKGLWATIFGK